MFRTKVDNTPKRRNVFAQLVVGSGTVGRVSHVHFTPMCTLNSDAERAAGCQLERAAQRTVSSVFFFFQSAMPACLGGYLFFIFLQSRDESARVITLGQVFRLVCNEMQLQLPNCLSTEPHCCQCAAPERPKAAGPMGRP